MTGIPDAFPQVRDCEELRGKRLSFKIRRGTTSATNDEAGNLKTRTHGRGFTATYAYVALD